MHDERALLVLYARSLSRCCRSWVHAWRDDVVYDNDGQKCSFRPLGESLSFLSLSDFWFLEWVTICMFHNPTNESYALISQHCLRDAVDLAADAMITFWVANALLLWELVYLPWMLKEPNRGSWQASDSLDNNSDKTRTIWKSQTPQPVAIFSSSTTSWNMGWLQYVKHSIMNGTESDDTLCKWPP